MNRMANDALHDRVATALTKRLLRSDGLIENGEVLAEAALTALGVDDFDALVERGAQRLIRMYSFFEPSDNDYAWRAARAVLDAALSATEGGES